MRTLKTNQFLSKSHKMAIVTIAVMFIFGIANAQAEQQVSDEVVITGGMDGNQITPRTFPAQVSIFYPMGTHGQQSVDYQYNFSLNLFYGRIGGLNGVEISGLVGRVDGDVRGVQVAGIGNMAGNFSGYSTRYSFQEAGNVSGIQVAGIFNGAGNIIGIQTGGIFNGAGNVVGVQTAGIVNGAGNLVGIQTAGIFNGAGNVNGIQTAGIFNAAGNVTGMQVGGIFNVAANMNGIQIAGIFNRTQTLRGLQIGLISVNDTIESGGSLSLVNIVRRGFYRSWEVSVADYSNLAVTYRMGTRTLYTIYTVGANFIEDNLWNFGIGFGHRRAISNNLDFRPEIVSYNYFSMDFKDIQPTFSTHLKFGFVYNVSKNFGISITPSVFQLSSRRCNSDADFYRVSPIAPFYTRERNN